MEKPYYIYGAGSLANFLAPLLNKTGFSVNGIVDDKKVGVTFAGHRVISLQEMPPEANLLICVLNNWADISLIRQTAQSIGCDEVLTPPEIFFLLGEKGLNIDWYWLHSQRSLVESIFTRSSKLLQNRLIDDVSKDTFDAIFKYRLDGFIPSQIIFPEEDQYFETGFEDFWSGEISFIDCGSYTGDTLQQISNRDLDLIEVLAIEPDSTNFTALCKQIKWLGIKAICLNSAIGSENCVVNFDTRGDSGSRISSSDETSSMVSQIMFDSTFPTSCYSHVKMDIEGSELAALKGMRRLLVDEGPKLALSVYHKPEDLVTIPDFLINECGYRSFSLRTFANQTFETILYAVKD